MYRCSAKSLSEGTDGISTDFGDGRAALKAIGRI